MSCGHDIGHWHGLAGVAKKRIAKADGFLRKLKRPPRAASEARHELVLASRAACQLFRELLDDFVKGGKG